MSSAYRAPVDVLILLMDQDSDPGEKFLLMKRAGDAPASGMWGIPSGGVEAGEDAVSTVCRELHEELGITVARDDVRSVGVTHARPPRGDARVGFAFAVTRWQGTPRICEPQVCSELRWCTQEELAQLEPVMSYTREIVRLRQERETFSTFGWESPLLHP